MVKKIISNLILIFLTFAAIEFYCFQETKKQNDKFKLQASQLKENRVDKFQTKYKILEDFNPTVFRKSFILKDTGKKSVLWCGCSFAEGAGLDDYHTPCFKISELTNRSCINKSKGATGTQYVYYQILNDNSSDVDFVIYTFIWNHLYRLYNYQVNQLIYMFNLRYKYDAKTGLKEIKPIFKPLYSSFFVKKILNKQVHRNSEREGNNFFLFNATMKQISNLVHSKYPNAKFIMIEFPELSRHELPDSEIEILKSYGIEIFRAKDYLQNIELYDEKYWYPDKIHPREELWDLILPKLKDEYNM